MIHSLFFPPKVGEYYLFKKKTIAFSLSKQNVTALLLACHARTKVIEQVVSEAILYDQYETPELAISATIKKIILALGSYDEVTLVISSSHAIFKELTIPLLDEEKIAQIISFELENYLPFPIANALFDFIITNQDITTQNSNVFAVAIQKEKIDASAQLFLEAGVKIDTFLIDAFSQYDLYKSVNLSSEGKAQLLVLSDSEKTTTLYLENNILKKIRILQEAPAHDSDAWWKALGFTFDSCTENWSGEKEFILYGSYSSEFLAKATLMFPDTCLSISLEKIIEQLAVTIKNPADITLVSLENLSAALDLPLTQQFNLTPSNSHLETTRKTISNYITALLLLVLLYGSFATHAFFEIRKFTVATEKIKTDTMKNLRTALPSLKATNPSEAIRKAKAEITKEEDIWFSFSSQTRHSFLTYLFDLSTTIDRETLGLDLKKMTFNKNGITLDGSVRSFDAVEELIKELKKTELFTQVPNLQKTEFSMPLTLINQEERS